MINPYGLSYDEITASSLVKIDGAGEIVMRSEPERGFGPRRK
jgi:ribulose-5-phosphate 4-epimerase/fuculose-1-phosphate aldolase